MLRSRVPLSLAIIFGLVAIPGCRDGAREASTESSRTAEQCRARGKIVGISPEKIDLHHERIAAIRGFDGTFKPMESMTMPFGRNRTSFAGLVVGDIVDIQFTVHFDSDPTLRLVEITKLPVDTKLDIP